MDTEGFTLFAEKHNVCRGSVVIGIDLLFGHCVGRSGRHGVGEAVKGKSSSGDDLEDEKADRLA